MTCSVFLAKSYQPRMIVLVYIRNSYHPRIIVLAYLSQSPTFGKRLVLYGYPAGADEGLPGVEVVALPVTPALLPPHKTLAPSTGLSKSKEIIALKELYTSILSLAQKLVLILLNNEFKSKILISTPFGRKIRERFRLKNHKSKISG